MSVALRNSEFGISTQKPINILILDDDSFDRKRIRRWVQRAGNSPVVLSEAACLQSFAEELQNNMFDLVLLDFALADGTGLDALKLVRGCAHNASNFVVMISGRDDKNLKDTCLLSGCDAFMSKSSLDLAKIRELLLSVRATDLEAELPKRISTETALDYWRARAERRALRDSQAGRATNQAILRDLLGQGAVTPIVAAPSSDISNLSPEMSSALRLFIEDFLSADVFVFEDFPALTCADQESLPSDPST